MFTCFGVGRAMAISVRKSTLVLAAQNKCRSGSGLRRKVETIGLMSDRKECHREKEEVGGELSTWNIEGRTIQTRGTGGKLVLISRPSIPRGGNNRGGCDRPQANGNSRDSKWGLVGMSERKRYRRGKTPACEMFR